MEIKRRATRNAPRTQLIRDDALVTAARGLCAFEVNERVTYAELAERAWVMLAARANRDSYSPERKRLFSFRLRKFLDGKGPLPQEEIAALRTVIDESGYPSKQTREHFAKCLHGDLFHMLAATLDMDSEAMESLGKRFALEPGKREVNYQVFRFLCDESGRIGIGKLVIRQDKKTGEVSTVEEYRSANKDYRLNGWLVRQRDGAYRIFAKHSTGEVQTISFPEAGVRDYPARKGTSRARSMIGAFFDRHDMNYFYGGHAFICRVDAEHRAVSKPTSMSMDQLRRDNTFRNPTGAEILSNISLLRTDARLYQLVEFQCDSKIRSKHTFDVSNLVSHEKEEPQKGRAGNTQSL